MSKAEDELEFQLKAARVDGWEREYRFHDKRRWRFDFAWPAQMLACEIEGFNGRHQTTKGVRQDIEKYQAANRLGWSIYRTSAQLVKNGQALETIEIMLR